MEKLQELGARNVLISMGAEGAVLLDEKGGVYSKKAPDGLLVSSVGAGDSMVAGFLAGWIQSHAYDQAFCMGWQPEAPALFPGIWQNRRRSSGSIRCLYNTNQKMLPHADRIFRRSGR